MSSFSVVHDLLSGIENAPSGTAAFYLPGTLTPLVIYGDDQGNATTNPVTLDSTGRATIYLSQLARMIVQTTGAVTVVDTVINAGGDVTVVNTSTAFTGNTQKDINDAALTAFGGQDWRYVPATGAGGMLPKTWMTGVLRNVMAYASTTAPTVNDGVTPADSAIAAAVADVVAAGGGIVYFPPGTYLISSAIAVTSSNGVSFLGSGIASTTIKSSSGSANVFTVTSGNNFKIEALNITASGASTGTAIALSNCSGVILSKVGVDAVSTLGKHKFGLDVAGATANLIFIDACQFYATGAGARACFFEASSFGNYNFLVNSYLSPQVEFTNATARVFASNCVFANAVIFNASLSGVGFDFANCLMSSGFTFSGSDDRIAIRTGLGQTSPNLSFAVGTSQTPDRSGAIWCRMTASSGGAGAITVNAPTPAPNNNAPDDAYFGIRFKNASGGAVTWNLNAVFKTTAAIPTTDGHTINVLFGWDSTASAWREVSRADTVT